MYFVDRATTPSPPVLLDFQTQYSNGWKEYVRQKSLGTKGIKPPTDSRWRDQRILEALVRLFRSNCGYCGSFTHSETTDQGTRYHGHVDHFFPKVWAGHLVYSWENYVWACKDCNEKKREFFEDPHLLNPCFRPDTDCLFYETLEGSFELKQEFLGNAPMKKKFFNTNKNTLINAKSKNQERKNYVSDILFRLEIIKEGFGDREEQLRRLQERLCAVQSFKCLGESIISDFISRHPDFPIPVDDLIPLDKNNP